MNMRLWYQSLANLELLPHYADALHAMVERYKAPGVTVEIHGTKVGGLADQYRYYEFLETKDIIDTLPQVKASGVDALLIGNILDPGLREAREVMEIPVLGLNETSTLLACMMGHRVGYIAPNRKFAASIEENVRRYGLSNRSAGVECLDFHIPDLDTAFADPELGARLQAEFVRAGRSLIARGAEVLIPAGGVVMVFLGQAGLHAVDGAPILNGVIGLLQMGPMMVQLGQATGGAFISRCGMYGMPTARVLQESEQYYGPSPWR
jgi:allantoin racemase